MQIPLQQENQDIIEKIKSESVNISDIEIWLVNRIQGIRKRIQITSNLPELRLKYGLHPFSPIPEELQIQRGETGDLFYYFLSKAIVERDTSTITRLCEFQIENIFCLDGSLIQIQNTPEISHSGRIIDEKVEIASGYPLTEIFLCLENFPIPQEEPLEALNIELSSFERDFSYLL